ncbi:hypothetical protein SJAG_05242 [Schizosaccharomyces japonicus yFS275]|uniref:GATA-type domain-containing protein n=1 Tax=Schizosaccharomyces japonicus (strain yFS275 / FY16936) TaxID=402676 RepID=B6JYM0_SCHJY|nr:hypothetical protein SJAG_05242 [Schizosaccharomyces japonicus yFS275]EEB06638.1 hypothetical protein SJAG_05242 [Schizosaccharomyces japonicus yFS275]
MPSSNANSSVNPLLDQSETFVSTADASTDILPPSEDPFLDAVEQGMLETVNTVASGSESAPLNPTVAGMAGNSSLVTDLPKQLQSNALIDPLGEGLLSEPASALLRSELPTDNGISFPATSAMFEVNANDVAPLSLASDTLVDSGGLPTISPTSMTASNALCDALSTVAGVSDTADSAYSTSSGRTTESVSGFPFFVDTQGAANTDEDLPQQCFGGRSQSLFSAFFPSANLPVTHHSNESSSSEHSLARPSNFFLRRRNWMQWTPSDSSLYRRSRCLCQVAFYHWLECRNVLCCYSRFPLTPWSPLDWCESEFQQLAVFLMAKKWTSSCRKGFNEAFNESFGDPDTPFQLVYRIRNQRGEPQTVESVGKFHLLRQISALSISGETTPINLASKQSTSSLPSEVLANVEFDNYETLNQQGFTGDYASEFAPSNVLQRPNDSAQAPVSASSVQTHSNVHESFKANRNIGTVNDKVDLHSVNEKLHRNLRKVKGRSQKQLICMECGTSESPEWRKGPTGPKMLCNACGLRWAKQQKRLKRAAKNS